jgi:hypothetical protein
MRRLLVPIILPAACAWVARQERRILAAGRPLTPAELADAAAIGIAEPARVRLLAVPTVPLPLQRLARFSRLFVGTTFEETSGLTARFGIYLRADVAGDRHLVVHELTHTAQYERLGGIRPFLRQYLAECLTRGYSAAPLEEDARRSAAKICSAP